jgi:hypothetical protein
MQPSALVCSGESLDREQRVRRFVEQNGITVSSLKFVKVGSFGVGEIDACDGAPGERWHATVNGRRDLVVSIFGCLCCKEDGTTSLAWRRPHWSVNLSRRGR